ncbi:MAG: type II toxin-antitoxin system VapC family toxin [Deltaproteobacteria bacterium]|nr:type II toxin-antitoxin system VapC family toxin [Deltaproteobacteria bacterium]
MRVLLDTHAWLWAVSAPERLGRKARRLIEKGETELLLSAASAWEISIKFHLGKLGLPEQPDRFVPTRMQRDGILALPVSVAHGLEVANLPLLHRDPFDRLLVAQCRVEHLPILSADPVFKKYGIEVVAAGR